MLTSRELCAYWLELLSRGGRKDVLFGETGPILKTLEEIDVRAESAQFYLEFPLAGTPHTDFMLQLKRGDRILAYRKTEYCRFFDWFAGSKGLGQAAGFEFDLGKDAPPSFFFTLENAPEYARRLGEVLDLLGWKGSGRNSLFRLLEKTEGIAGFWHIGLMTGREASPLRLCCVLKREQRGVLRARGLCRTLKCLGLPEFFEPLPEFFADYTEYGWIWNLDILADGSTGPVFGWDFCLPVMLPGVQKKFLASGGKRFPAMLMGKGAADKRLALLDGCIRAEYVPWIAPSGELEFLTMASLLSHFKLTWRDGRLERAKAYVRIAPVRPVRKLSSQ